MATDSKKLSELMTNVAAERQTATQDNTANATGAGTSAPQEVKTQKMDAQVSPQSTQATQPKETEAVSNHLTTADQVKISNPEDQKTLLELKGQWRSTNTPEQNAAVHEQAERLRAKYGFSGGMNGSQNISLNDTDMQYLSDDDKYNVLQAKNQWYEAKAKGDKEGQTKANKVAQAIRAKYGYIQHPDSGEYVKVGLYVDPNTKKQYVATTNGDFVRTQPAPITIVDENGKEKVLTDAEGNKLTSDMLVIGDDGRTYIAATGQPLSAVAERFGITDANTRINVNGKYYSITGYNTTKDMGALGVKDWTDNDIYNTLYQQLSQLGLQRTPYASDYDTLNWDQALARASQQLNGRYNQALQNSMDQINRAALKTGFYGQLPTEALKAQAAASTELERQSAINELANTLMQDSRTEAQRLYEDDTKSVQEQMDVIMQLYNYLYKLNQDAINNEEDQTRLDQSQQTIDLSKEQNATARQELLLKAAQTIDQLAAEGYSAAQVSAWLSAQE